MMSTLSSPSVLASDLKKVTIVGSGLIGTSIALALAQQSIEIEMVDSDTRAQALAQDLIGQEPTANPSDLVILALPISALSQVIDQVYQTNLNSTFMDVCSVKTKVKAQVTDSSLPNEKFLPSHPMAGREVGGAESARADLFLGRIWAFDPDGVSEEALAYGLKVIEICGATALSVDSVEHDKTVALTSHLPQLMSSLLAMQLEQSNSATLDLAGSGLRDTTRLAASSSGLWEEIIVANAPALKPLLSKTINDLNQLLANIDDGKSVREFFQSGNRGRALIPGKHGGSARDYTFLPVVIEDKAGELARLFEACAIANVNIEDLSIEHSPEQFTGLITLALSEKDAGTLYQYLIENGWKAHLPRQ